MNISAGDIQLCSAALSLLLAAAIMPKMRESQARILGLGAMVTAALFALTAGLAPESAAQAARSLVSASAHVRLILITAWFTQGIALLIGIPKTNRIPVAAFDILLVQAGSLLVIASHTVALEVAGCILTLIPAYISLGRHGRFTRRRAIPRGFIIFQTMSTTALLAGTLLPIYTPLSLNTASAFLILAGMLRQGIPPFHTSMLRFFENAPLSYVIPFVSSPIGVLLVAGATRHLADLGFTEVGYIMAAFMMASLVYVGLLALVQRSCRSLLRHTTTFSWALTAACFAAINPLSRDAGSLLVTGSMSAIVGLGMTVWLLDERLGHQVGLFLRGLASRLPVLATMFWVFGLATVGLPFTASFASEDLWLHGFTKQHAATGLLVIVGCSLLAIAIFRIYTAVFLGPGTELPTTTDLNMRERTAFACVLVTLMVFGVAPWLGLA